MQFWDITRWAGINQLAILAIILMLSNVIRRKVGFLRKSLIPTAVLGGFILLFIKSINPSIGLFPTDFINVQYMETITFHTLAIGFISLALKSLSNQKKTTKTVAVESGLVIVGTYVVQAVVGLIVTITLALTFFPSLITGAGMLLPMGFGQGPGPAGNMGNVYEFNEVNPFVGGTAFGLSIASFGFIWACVGGVTYLNYLVRKKKLQVDENQTVNVSVESHLVEEADEIPLSEAIDKFTVQFSLVLIVYFVTYLFMKLIDAIILTGAFGAFGLNSLRPLIWGFNFIWATLFALLFKRIFGKLRDLNIMQRKYPNDYMLNRIAGTAFDFMIIASIAAINIADLERLWIPFLILTTVGGFVTFFYVKYICKRVYPDYELEATISMFGMLTGTASTGIALLREVDPHYQTPAAHNLVVGASTAILFGFPLLLLVGLAYLSNTLAFVTLGITVVAFVIINLFLLRKQIFKKA
jgi:glutamate:Na+ symporter, ESS family